MKKYRLILIGLTVMLLVFSGCSNDKKPRAVEETIGNAIPKLHNDGVWTDELEILKEDIKSNENVLLISKEEDSEGIKKSEYDLNDLKFSFSRSLKKDNNNDFFVYSLEVKDQNNLKELSAKDIIDYRFIDDGDEKEFLIYMTLDDFNINRVDTSVHFLSLKYGNTDNINSYELGGQFGVGNKMYLNALDDNEEMSFASVNYKYLGDNSDGWFIDIFKFDGNKFNMINNKGNIGVTSTQEMDDNAMFKHRVETVGDIDRYKYLLKEVSGDFLSDDEKKGNVKYALGNLDINNRELFNVFDSDGEYKDYIIENKIVRKKHTISNLKKHKDEFVEIIENQYINLNKEDRQNKDVIKPISDDIDLFLEDLLDVLENPTEKDKKVLEKYKGDALHALKYKQ